MFNYKKSNTEAIESIDLYFNSNEAILGAYPVFLDADCSKQPEDVSKIKDIILNKNINLIDIAASELDRGSLATFKPIFVKYLPVSNAICVDILVNGRNGLNVLNLRLNSVLSGEDIPIPHGEDDDGAESSK